MKDSKRIAAFGCVVLLAPIRLSLRIVSGLAAMVYTLLERQVRRALAQPEEEAVEGQNRQPTHKPTTYAIQTALSAILIVGQRKRGQLELSPSFSLTRNQQRLLRLAGFDEGIYH